ncbi:hypothetical protein T4A_8164 [Trichinella pseudospiralis]|uniref:Uncharacterized protein n=1 Tax=Trichinella pseudospiralis TaxID=6337 RepID=A0A0V1ERX3_TRIPS|nr:hypothetical protein T4A_8164 [Trichinella pseudospiralis]
MAKGAHSFSRSHSPTRSNSARSSGQSHLSKGGKSEQTGKRPASPNGQSEVGRRGGSWSNASQVRPSSSRRSSDQHRNDASRLAKSQKRSSPATKTSKSLDHHSGLYSTDGSDASHRSESRSRRSRRRWSRNSRRSTSDGSPFRSLDCYSQLDSTDGSDASRRSESRSRRSRRRRKRNRRRSARRRRSTASRNGSPFRSLDHKSDASRLSESRSRRSRRRRRRRNANRRRRRSRARSRSHLRHHGAAPCQMPELFSCSCHAGIYCEDCFRTLRRSFRDKFERSISKRTTLKLPDDGKIYLLAPSGRSMYRKLYVPVKSPEHEGTLCTAAKYPSQRHSFSGRDEEINRKLLKKLYFKNHHIRKGKKKRKHDRGT